MPHRGTPPPVVTRRLVIGVMGSGREAHAHLVSDWVDMCMPVMCVNARGHHAMEASDGRGNGPPPRALYACITRPSSPLISCMPSPPTSPDYSRRRWARGWRQRAATSSRAAAAASWRWYAGMSHITTIAES